MSQDYTKMSVEDRLARLEDEAEKRASSVRALATMVIFMDSNPNPFASPLKQFFRDSDKFFNDVYEDVGGCINLCVKDLQSDLEAAGNDQVKREQAFNASRRCVSKCPPLRF